MRISDWSSDVCSSDLVWISSLASNFGGLIQSVGASWMMTSIGSAELVALVQASVTLPIMLLSLPAGALADNIDRRKTMLAAQGFMLVVSVALALCAWVGFIDRKSTRLNSSH